MDRILANMSEKEFSTINRCVSVAAELHYKTVRDVAVRLRAIRVKPPPFFSSFLKQSLTHCICFTPLLPSLQS